MGVYIGSGYAVDARGRDSGVIKQRLDAAGWNRFASLEMLNEQGISAVDAAMPSYGRCTGKSVYVRSGAGGTYPILATAHRGIGYLHCRSKTAGTGLRYAARESCSRDT